MQPVPSEPVSLLPELPQHTSLHFPKVVPCTLLHRFPLESVGKYPRENEPPYSRRLDCFAVRKFDVAQMSEWQRVHYRPFPKG